MAPYFAAQIGGIFRLEAGRRGDTLLRGNPRSPAMTRTHDVRAVPVREIMRHGVVSVPEHASLEAVFHAMADHRVHAMLVVAPADGRPLGWVKAEALLNWMNLSSDGAHAHQAITEPVAAIAPDAPVREAIEALSRPGTSRLLVCDEGTVAGEGVVTPLDIVALRSR
jgi:CBS domain-containing protein